MTVKRPTTALLLALALGSAVQSAPRWKWQLPVERYQKLNVFQRAQYDKAAKLLEQGSTKAAASEFEKFKVQFPDSPVLPHILLMRGYCLHQAKLRHKAIKVYHELLDYFADEVDEAAAALYWMGVAHLENGDTREGMGCMKRMMDDEDYRQHPLAAGALGRLAENHVKNNEPAKAVACWKQLCRDFARVNAHEVNQAREHLTVHYIKQRDYAGYEAWAVEPERRDDAPHRVRVATGVIDRAHNIFRWHSGHYSRFDQQRRAADVKACFEYFAARRGWFEKAGQQEPFLQKAVTFLSQYHRDKALRDKLVDDYVALIKKIEDKKTANGKYAWLADRLREGGDYARCRAVIAMMTDRPYAAYKECEILIQQQDWHKAVARLEQIEQMGNDYWAAQALERRAWITKDYLHQYQKAIQLYRQSGRPPWSLWQIQDCFMRWGKLAEAITTLSEIENSFPDDAARAAWHKAKYYHEAKQAKKAIAQARKILKAYKKSSEASLAHQLLEKYGVPTGGGVFDEE